MLEHLRGKSDERTLAQRMATEIAEFSFTETGTELLALLLEDRLIKREYPEYNVRQREFREYRGDVRLAFRVRDREAHAGVLEHGAELALAVAGVGGHHHRTAPEGREVGDDEARGVPQVEGDPVALPDPERPQLTGRARHVL